MMKNVLRQNPCSATMIALVIYIFGASNSNVVNGVISDYRSGFLVTNPCVSKQTCSECLQTPTCAWCMKEVRMQFKRLAYFIRDLFGI